MALEANDEELAIEPEGEFFSKPLAPQAERRSTRHLWLISYSDFMTILMIFFLAMYGYTYLAKAQLVKLQGKTDTSSEFADRIHNMQGKLGNQLKVQDDVDKIVLQLNEKILFQSGQSRLSSLATSTLDDLAKSIMLIQGDVIVQGHTDNIPIRGGRYKSNWELSTARAFSVIEELTKRGIPPERLAAWGFGENRPIADNSTSEKRAQNRRIEVIILKKKKMS